MDGKTLPLIYHTDLSPFRQGSFERSSKISLPPSFPPFKKGVRGILFILFFFRSLISNNLIYSYSHEFIQTFFLLKNPRSITRILFFSFHPFNPIGSGGPLQKPLYSSFQHISCRFDVLCPGQRWSGYTQWVHTLSEPSHHP